jgi:radical SAM protein with 4Fe4S-binding SPASM domain
MLNVTRLLCGCATPGDALRYGTNGQNVRDGGPAAADGATPDASGRRPVVVWNCTRRCNLKCLHCYSESDGRPAPDELSTAEARTMLADLARFGVPVVLFSGGEPLLRPDVLDLARAARDLGLRAVLSTNGTLITEDMARRIAAAGVAYVGISLDGLGEVNDRFRGSPGAFDLALAAFRHLRQVGQRVGLRLTLTRRTAADLEGVFDLLEAEDIDRACFYHLVYAGRGSSLVAEDLTYAEKRRAVDLVFRRTTDFCDRGMTKDILTVDNHADGAYLYLHLAARDAAPGTGPDGRADQVRRLLAWNGGARFSTGVGLGCIGPGGDVHPDQFWRHYTLGNVRRRPFSDIWSDTQEPLLAALRDRLPRLKGRCRLCRHRELCGGSSRVRAEAVFGDPWAPEPACYLTYEEIGLTPERRADLAARGESYPVPSSLAGG